RARTELEGIDVSVPIEGSIRRQVFSGEHHGTTINWVNTDRAVISPTSKVGQLRTTSRKHGSLVAERAQRIQRRPISITNARFDRAAIRDAVPDRDAASLVHRSAAHPAKVRARSKSALLPNHRRRGGHGLTDRIL